MFGADFNGDVHAIAIVWVLWWGNLRYFGWGGYGEGWVGQGVLK